MDGQEHEATTVVPLPAEIDRQNAEQVRHLLCAAWTPGVAVVVADLALTTFCHSSGIRELMTARRHLAYLGADLRLAVPDGPVRRAIRLTGIDQALPVFSSVAAAVAAAPSPAGPAGPRA